MAEGAEEAEECRCDRVPDDVVGASSKQFGTKASSYSPPHIVLYVLLSGEVCQ